MTPQFPLSTSLPRARRMRWLFCAVALALSGCADSPPARALRIASASTSMTLCTSAFVSGMDPDQAFRDEVREEPGMGWVSWALRYRVDREQRAASTTIASTAASRAVYREGLGCLLAAGDVQPLAWRRPVDAPWPTDPFPTLAQAGTVAAKHPEVLRAIDEAFTEPDVSARRNTLAVVVVHQGQLIGERYAPGVSHDTPLPGHSLSKSMTDAWVGILSRLGLLQPEAPVPLADWRAAADASPPVTPRQLLAMAGGLPWDEYRGGFDPATRMWFDEPDPYGYARRMPLSSKPGTEWAYSNLGYTVLSRLVRDAAGGKATDVLELAQRELLDPLGMRHTVIGFDATGTPMGANGVLASARDWARFGLLYLNDGRVGDRRILPGGWAAGARVPTLDAGYGRGFWLNNTRAAHPLPGHWGMPGAPADTFFGRGHLGQFVVIVPSRDLVVVRLGTSHRPGGDIESVGRMVGRIVAAIDK